MRHTRAATIARAGRAIPVGDVPAAEVSMAELDVEAAALLPRRDTLCAIGCVNVTTVVGINLAFAINAATANSTANAFAGQYLVAFR